MPNRVEQPIVRTTLAPLNDINETVPGGQPSASGANIYASQLGMRVVLDGNPGGVRWDPNVGVLYGGWFQYVQFYSGSTAANALGRPVVWAYDQVTVAGNVYAAFQQYIVSPDGNSALRTGRFAGIALNAVAKGNYGWIQVRGLATVRYATLAGTPNDGDLVYLDAASGNVLNSPDATSMTAAINKATIGSAVGAPVSAGLGVVLLKAAPQVI